MITVAITHSDAGDAFPTWMILFASGLLLAAWWLVRSSVVIVLAWRAGRPRALGALRAGLVIPASLVLAILFSWTRAPLTVRLYLSSEALLRGAPALAQTTDRELYQSPRWVGLE
jgi:hypothetical protein